MKLMLRTVLLALIAIGSIWAQSDANKGSINGAVTDPNSAVVPGAKVTVTNPSSGLTRLAATNEEGLYRVAALDPGTYQVKVDAPGFATATADGVLVTVGTAVTVNLPVSLQATVQSVDVAAAMVAVSETENSQTVASQAIRDLPINGRRFQDFATLTPTVQATSDTRGQLSFVGQRGINSNVMVDGTDYNEPFFGGIRGGERSIFAPTVPQSSVQEFQVITSGYTAEYGRSTGGILNAITKSGTNGYHGDGFYLLRHKELGLKNPLNQESLETQQQFGGGVGGPIKHDKLFFFGAYEQQIAKYPRRVRFSALDSITNVTPNIAPAYSYFRSLEGPYKQTNDAKTALGRVDYNFGSGSRLGVRYNHSDNSAQNAVSVGNILNPEINTAVSGNGTEKDNTDTVVGQLTSIISPSVVNDLRAQYSHEGRPRLNNSSTPNLSASVIGTFGATSFLPTTLTDYRTQLADSITIQHGAHAFKFGGDYSFLHAQQAFGFNQFGRFIMSGSNVTTLLKTLSASGGATGNRFDDSSTFYLRQIGNLQLAANSQQLAFFGQDSWKVTRAFTLNYGLRWEGQFNPKPVANNDFLVSNVKDFTFPLGRFDPTVVRSQLAQFAPRLGFAWDATGDGKTVLRAQTGLYYAQTPTLVYAGPLNNFRVPPGDLSIQIGPNPSLYKQFLGIGIDLNTTPINQLPLLTIDQVKAIAGPAKNPYFGAGPTLTSANNYRNPRAFQATMGAEREVARGLVIDYQFNLVNTVHLERTVDVNVPVPFVKPGDQSFRQFFGLRSGTKRPNPNLSSVLVRDSGARSLFAGSTFRAQYRMRKIQFSTQYTLSYNKSDDDNERNTGASSYQNPFNFKQEYNWSTFDTRHQISGYTVYQAPWGIELSGLFRFHTGYPIDPTTGGDTSELLNGISRPLQAPGVPFLRNSFRNRNYKTIDARFLKSFTVHETVKLQFSAEMFNALNFENIQFQSQGFIYGLGILPSGQPAPIDPRFERLKSPITGKYDSSTVFQQGTPFQAQLGLRVIF